MAITSAATSEHHVRVGRLELPGLLSVPAPARGLVIFAHGSGSSRLSSRNQRVASHLQDSGLATLLFDLLREPEAQDRANVFDIHLLAARLLEATTWAAAEPRLARLAIGYFGASTGAAAALVAAAELGNHIGAVVSRGGRPDLASAVLPRVLAPTLFIVGERDLEVLRLNELALHDIAAKKELVVVPGATHLFEERGALELVAAAALRWFGRYLARATAAVGAPPAPSTWPGAPRARSPSPKPDAQTPCGRGSPSR